MRGEDKISDKCAVFGIIGEKNASELTYYALHNLQHRGQETAGIVSYDGEMYHYRRGKGIVNDVFVESDFSERLVGHAALGHVRYSTKGGSEMYNAQPFVENDIVLAHNGEIANYEILKRMLRKEGAIFQSRSDTEVFLKLLHRTKGSIEQKVMSVGNLCRPSYSMVLLGEGKLVGVRDAAGVRPLVLGKTKNGYALASESVAFDAIEAEYVRSLRPGEIIVISSSRMEEIKWS